MWGSVQVCEFGRLAGCFDIVLRWRLSVEMAASQTGLEAVVSLVLGELIGNLISRPSNICTRESAQIKGLEGASRLAACWRATGTSLQAKFALILQLARRLLVPIRIGDN